MWAHVMRTTIAYNGSYFNTDRMVRQYARSAYYTGVLVSRSANVEEEEPLVQ